MNNSTRSFRFGGHETVVTFGPVSGVFEAEGRNGLLVCDRNTEKLAKIAPLATVVLDSGEHNKNWRSVERILESAVKLELGRDSWVFGLGGGVVCDMAAFAASVYMRGCRLALVPTTLLAMVDASIGGKTGIDFAGFKNLVGSFYPADRVHIAVEALGTLAESDFRSGLAEVIKHALLGAGDLLSLLEERPDLFSARDPAAVEMSISRSLDIKGDIVTRDFTENGVRSYLNFGHTFGHALESAGGFGVFSHGEAVAWGMDRALAAGVLSGITDSGYALRVRRLLDRYGYHTGAVPGGVDVEAVLAAMKQDKKKRQDRLRFVLQRNLGETIVTSLEESVVREVLASDQVSYRRLSRL